MGAGEGSVIVCLFSEDFLCLCKLLWLLVTSLVLTGVCVKGIDVVFFSVLFKGVATCIGIFLPWQALKIISIVIKINAFIYALR